MDLSLTDAARALGKTPRQVRYMLKTGALAGHKADNGRWVIRDQDLPLSEGQRRARARKAGELDRAVQQALGPHLDSRARGSFSMADMAAFHAGVPLYRTALSTLNAEHPALSALRQAIVAVGRGCHRFHAREKYQAYCESRELAATAVALLLLDDATEAHPIAKDIEQNVLPAIVGLIRRYESPRR